MSVAVAGTRRSRAERGRERRVRRGAAAAARAAQQLCGSSTSAPAAPARLGPAVAPTGPAHAGLPQRFIIGQKITLPLPVKNI